MRQNRISSGPTATSLPRPGPSAETSLRRSEPPHAVCINSRIEMPRFIQVREAKSVLQARFTLLDDASPVNAGVLWSLSEPGATYDAIRAMWTGPEISCPIDASRLTGSIEVGRIPLENATSFPAAGDLALVAV